VAGRVRDWIPVMRYQYVIPISIWTILAIRVASFVFLLAFWCLPVAWIGSLIQGVPMVVPPGLVPLAMFGGAISLWYLFRIARWAYRSRRR
jgi:hypothetical protein